MVKLTLFLMLWLFSVPALGKPAATAESLFNVEFLTAEISEFERQAEQVESVSEREELLQRANEVRTKRRTEFGALSKRLSSTLSEAQRRDVVVAIISDIRSLNLRYRTKKDDIVSIRNRMEASGAEAKFLEDELDGARHDVVGLLSAKWKDITYLERLEPPEAGPFEVEIASEVAFESRALASTLSTLLEQKKKTQKRAAGSDEEKRLKASELVRIQDRVDRLLDELRTLVELLKETGQDATTYQQLLIEGSGTVTADILDKKVSVGLAEKWLEETKEDIVSKAPVYIFKLIWFVLVLLLAKLASSIVGWLAKRWLRTSKFSQLASEFLHKSAMKIVFLIGVLFGLSQLGFDVTALIAGFGVAGLVIGFALQDTLSNFASGLMILFYQPFDTGDLIRAADVEGVVDKMTLVSTEILTLDNQRFIIPNNKVWQNVIQNVTAETTRRVDFLFGVGYSDDLKHAEEVLIELVTTDAHVLPEPAPIVKVHELADSSVNFVVRMWVNTDAYWEAYWSITRRVKDRFDAEGISIPFPQRDVHYIPTSPPASSVTTDPDAS